MADFRALQMLGLACPLVCILLWMSAAQVQAQPASLITSSIYHQFFLHTNDAVCSPGFFTYNAFVTAASAFPQFAAVGDVATRKRELAAFFAQVSKETTGGWPTAPDGPYAWGLCFKRELACDVLCQDSPRWPCTPGKTYCGRGPIQLSWNYNYGQAGEALRTPLLAQPELVETDPVLSWKTAIWFWMTPQSPKPSAHSVMVGQFQPSDADRAANRLPGFGLTTNIINGGFECGNGFNAAAQDRIAFYKRYTSILGVSLGANIDCSNQHSY